MLSSSVVLLLALASCWSAAEGGFLTGAGRPLRPHGAAAPGPPLFLTPFLAAGKAQAGREAAKVPPLKGTLDSYSGFFTVDNNTNSNMFFWYFPAEKNPESAPVVIWLQGGPGGSSLYGLFSEIGPFYVKLHKGLKMRDFYWSQVVNLVFVDNPVGTGFSFTDSDEGYSTDEVAVGKNLHETMMQFFTLFPDLQKNDFYIAGESYAGKYVPALGYTIHKENPTARVKINLKGLSIGDGLCAPEFMLGYSDYLYQIGLVDAKGRQEMKAGEDEVVSLIKQSKFVEAFEAFDSLLNGDLTPYKSTFYNLTNFNFYFNYLHDKDYSPFGDMASYLNKEIVRRSIHVGNLTFNDGNSKVEEKLKGDVMQSVKPWVETLLENNYRMLFYNGQLDIIVAYPLTVNFLSNLNWSGSQEYKTAQRNTWMVAGDLAGYVKKVKGGLLTEVLVRDAGHMVPFDQPLWALDMISRFTANKPFAK